MQFDLGRWWQQPLPSQQRLLADQLKRLPQESMGLWVPPHPRINSSSLFKLEQRLKKGKTLDVRRIVHALQEQFPEAQQPGASQSGRKVGPSSCDKAEQEATVPLGIEHHTRQYISPGWL